MPYTSAYVGALSLGFTTADLESMPFNRLMWFIYCHNNSQGSAKHGGPKQQDTVQGTAEMMKRFVG